MPPTGRKGKRPPERTPPLPDLGEQIGSILNRLIALEERSSSADRSAIFAATPEAPSCDSIDIIAGASSPASGPSSSRHPLQPATVPTLLVSPANGAIAGSVPAPSGDATERLVNAISALNAVRPTHYYVSDFDPAIHDVNVWCEEIDRAQALNRWNDNECLARVGNCLKGEARSWLSQWAHTDRTWSNFKQELKSLCPRRIDVANILFDVMCTDSDKYSTYAEYARKSLLRLRVVRGLSDELLSAIIIRGITDPQIRASATNAKLMPENIVEFLSIYVKPKITRDTHNHTFSRKRDNSIPIVPSTINGTECNPRKRRIRDASTVRCYTCGRWGHGYSYCPMKSKPSTSTQNNNIGATSRPPVEKCSFCKKSGHNESVCFTKERSESRNKGNVNFCREIEGNFKNRDVITAVLCGIPVDVLIDSGSYISLISADLLKHFSCKRNPGLQLLRGLGGTEIQSTSYVTLPIELSEISLEVDFYVVPPGCLSTPVIIGTDVLNRDGVAYIRTANSQQIVRKDTFVNNVTRKKSNVEVEQVNTPLVGDDKDRLVEVLNKYSDSFLSGTATTTVKTGQMHIRLTSEAPVCYRPYKLSYDEKLRVRAIVRDLLDKEIIRESESQYASPILLVKKKDGSDRMVVDYRALNQLTVKDRYPLPLIEDHVDRLGDSKYYTALDMVTGFHQICLSEDSVAKTAFVTPEGHYEYLKIPYGLANAPVVYQRIITDTLKPFIESGRALVYIDDVLLPSNSVQEGIELLDSVLKTLTDAGFSTNLRKCTFLANEVEYLGRLISDGQVRPSPRKVEALVNSPVPGNVKQVRQFLGLAGYFRRYIPGYATKTSRIAALTRKGVSFVWGSEQEQTRLDIISILTNEPVLTIFDPKLSTEVHTDASSSGYGGILMQIHNNGRKHVVAYFSKVTTGAEPKYHSYELETLAVVKSLQYFRQYLIGKHFKVVTDCNALKMTQRKKDLLPRVARWWMYLQDFDFTLEYRKGTLMSHADYLSRNPVNLCAARKPLNWAQVAQAADDETSTLIERLNDGQLDSTRYVIRRDLLYHKYNVTGEDTRLLCYVPKAYRLSLLRAFHDEHDHVGTDKTLDLILNHFWFPGIRHFVRKYISHCVVCVTHKRVPRAPLQPITSWQKPSEPFHTIHVDILGVLPESNGYKYVLILIDSFSKYCLLYPMCRQDSAELKRAITNAISLFGTPQLLVCDRGRMFDSIDFKSLMSDLGIQVHYITPGMHQSNGQVERYCRTVLNMIRIEVNHKTEMWSNVLWKLQLVLNVTKQKSTQSSALNLLIGTETTTPIINSLIKDIAVEGSNPNREAWRELHRQRAESLLADNRNKQDEYVNKNRTTARKFALNDHVYVVKQTQSTGKLDSGMRGPYRVTKLLPNGRYELRLLAGSYGKTTQAAAEYMIPWRGEWTPDACAAFFESLDDNLEAACLEQDGAEASTSTSPGEAAVSTLRQEDTSDAAGCTTPAVTTDILVGREDAVSSGEAVLGETCTEAYPSSARL